MVIDQTPYWAVLPGIWLWCFVALSENTLFNIYSKTSYYKKKHISLYIYITHALDLLAKIIYFKYGVGPFILYCYLETPICSVADGSCQVAIINNKLLEFYSMLVSLGFSSVTKYLSDNAVYHNFWTENKETKVNSYNMLECACSLKIK